ncbi:MAG TPA: TldD/PmbA family protein [Mycobacteriales bacterium]|nr:TldD/PmbA family protein [Mycobacteriales bacterium]
MAWGADRLLTSARAAFGAPGADGVEVLITRYDSALTRFAESSVHQNVGRVDGEARIRVVVDGARIGVVVTNDLSDAGIRRAAAEAVEVARVVPADEEFAGLARPAAAYPSAGVDDAETRAATADVRAAAVGRLLSALPSDAVGAGTVETGSGEIGVVSSTGVECYHRSTRARLSLLGSGPDSTGYAEDASGRLGDLDPDRLSRRVADKVQRGRAPRAASPGDYAVVLEPAATATLLQFLGWTAFGAKVVAEGRSPLSGRVGQVVCSPAVTIVDDPTSALLPGLPFDAEGVPTRRTDLIRDGVAVGVVHDLASAHAAGVESTGHALPAPNPDGAMPLHLIMEPGSASLDELVAGCERGLLITRFHYTNVVHPIESTITGMTRDGTFLVEDGRIAGAVHNLRFTQSILGALSGVEEVGADTELATELFFGAARAPAVRLSRFAFTSTTTF